MKRWAGQSRASLIWLDQRSRHWSTWLFFYSLIWLDRAKPLFLSHFVSVKHFLGTVRSFSGRAGAPQGHGALRKHVPLGRSGPISTERSSSLSASPSLPNFLPSLAPGRAVRSQGLAKFPRQGPSQLCVTVCLDATEPALTAHEGIGRSARSKEKS